MQNVILIYSLLPVLVWDKYVFLPACYREYRQMKILSQLLYCKLYIYAYNPVILGVFEQKEKETEKFMLLWTKLYPEHPHGVEGGVWDISFWKKKKNSGFQWF